MPWSRGRSPLRVCSVCQGEVCSGPPHICLCNYRLDPSTLKILFLSNGELSESPIIAHLGHGGGGEAYAYKTASFGDQVLRWKNPPAMQETWVQSLGWEDPLEKGKATHSSLLAWRIPWMTGTWRATIHGVAKSRT